MTNPIRKYHPNGQLESEEWRENSIRHRIGGPAVQAWHENGKLKYKGWFQNGQCHRLDGPAYQYWFMSEELKITYWHICGKIIDEHSHPFVKLLKQYSLYDKWKRDELTEDEQVLIKLSLENV